MGKQLKNPIAVVVTEVDGNHTVRADYGVISDGIVARRTMPITLSEQTINDIHEQTIAQIHAEEGTTDFYVEPEPEPEPEPEEPEPEPEP